ncbi:PREDICTED: two-pore potassium channel 1-like [Fragaria vesca subsp. vesca]|uniref:two-pore potassium channel 1-like n=1 Tax=Fragaria vesca subsp. vesca TaxID=101020 RepID=UPI0002C2F09E|nr:PREDICTED: two-pore potassium channel 1-like [Fragaria vesca subsp. vesca]
MDRNGMREPLLPGVIDPSPRAKTKNGPKSRRFRRTRSAPLAEYAPLEAYGIDSVQRPESVIHPSFVKVAIFLTVYLGLGTICFYLVRNQIEGEKTNAILDAVYFCIVTMTTLGYGDLVPDSIPAKLLACAFVFTGMALVGLILSQAADYLVEKQERLLIKGFHVHQQFGETDVLKEVETNSLRYKCITVFILLLVLMTSGTIFLATVEKLDLVDAFYCVCSTITTLGYGDKSFSTEPGRVFAVFWILTSTICLAQFFLYIAELYTQHRQRALVDFVLTRRMTNVDLEAADLDDDGVVGAAEFVIYKLKEMGKINQEDIRLVMEEFEALDVDQSGSLSVSDLTLAQS